LKSWQGEQLRRDDVTVMAFTVDMAKTRPLPLSPVAAVENRAEGLVPAMTF
jgi:hypothetical protein